MANPNQNRGVAKPPRRVCLRPSVIDRRHRLILYSVRPFSPCRFPRNGGKHLDAMVDESGYIAPQACRGIIRQHKAEPPGPIGQHAADPLLDGGVVVDNGMKVIGGFRA